MTNPIGARSTAKRRYAATIGDAIAHVRRAIAARKYAAGDSISVRSLARSVPCSKQTAMLALQQLREADVVRVDGDSLGRFIYVVRDAGVVLEARARELDALVARDLRALYDAGFEVGEIRDSYQRSLPTSFGLRSQP
jgi:DNA-binding transcriptional regulator YhcF (GntR family)